MGKIDITDKPFCITDQPCMHIDSNVNCIVFRPEQGKIYDCLVTAVDKVFHFVFKNLKPFYFKLKFVKIEV